MAINKLVRVEYGYTKKGNRYEKSSDEQKIGEITGGVLGLLACNKRQPKLEKSIRSATLELLKNKLPKVAEFLEKSKMFKFGTSLAAAFLIIGFCSTACKYIGKAVDAVKDISTKRQADKEAEKAK